MNEFDYTGAWITTFPNGYFEKSTNVIISFIPRNKRVFQVTLKFDSLGEMIFAPFWQRVCNDSFQLKLIWINEIILAEVRFDYSKNYLFCKWNCRGKSIITILTWYGNVIFPEKDTLILDNIGRYAMLKKYSDYAPCCSESNLNFSYADNNSAELVMLRERFYLNNLVANNDFYTMQNIMRFVNQNLIHDGYQNFGTNRDAVTILTMQNGRASCRGLAIVLSEALLSINIKSRFVACWPHEHPYEECHVVCIAYSQQYHKWILLDPTNNLYLLNQSGVPMDIAEFRNALLLNDSFKLSDNTNWNGTRITKNQYCNYMVKNMICFDSHIHLYSNCDKLSLDKVTLIPQNYDIEIKDRILVKSPDCFWKKPC